MSGPEILNNQSPEKQVQKFKKLYAEISLLRNPDEIFNLIKTDLPSKVAQRKFIDFVFQQDLNEGMSFWKRSSLFSSITEHSRFVLPPEELMVEYDFLGKNLKIESGLQPVFDNLTSYVRTLDPIYQTRFFELLNIFSKLGYKCLMGKGETDAFAETFSDEKLIFFRSEFMKLPVAKQYLIFVHEVLHAVQGLHVNLDQFSDEDLEYFYKLYLDNISLSFESFRSRSKIFYEFILRSIPQGVELPLDLLQFPLLIKNLENPSLLDRNSKQEMKNLNVECGKFEVYLKVIYKRLIYMSRLDLISDSDFDSMGNLISEVRLYILTMPSSILNREEFFSYILQNYYSDEFAIAGPDTDMSDSIQKELKSERFGNLVERLYQAMKAGIARAQ